MWGIFNFLNTLSGCLSVFGGHIITGRNFTFAKRQAFHFWNCLPSLSLFFLLAIHVIPVEYHEKKLDQNRFLHLVKASCIPQLLSGCVWTLNVRFVCRLSIVRPPLPSSNPAVSVFVTSWNHSYHKRSMMLLEDVRNSDLGFRAYPFVLDSVKEGEKTEVQC